MSTGGNWLQIDKPNERIYLFTETGRLFYLHTKYEVRAGGVISVDEGWINGSLWIRLEDHHAKDLLWAWAISGPLDFSIESLEMMPDGAREKINQSINKNQGL